MTSKKRQSISIVTPAYNEAQNIPILFQKLRKALEGCNLEWEWIVVDDHSTDDTFQVLQRLVKENDRIRVFRLSRNFGSHSAIRCGFQYAEKECSVIMAADLQDPPEEIPRLVDEWKKGAHVVWAVREHREGINPLHEWFSRMYYKLMKSTTALRDMPPEGADFFLIDRLVIDALNEFHDSNTTIFGLITWMGFRQTYINYTKQERLYGSSGWNLKKKLKLVVDSITSFTYFPIRLMSYVGFITSIIGFIYAGIILYNRFSGEPIEGWTSLIMVVLVIGGIQMIMLGILGEYLWRTMDQSRNRPPYIIEAVLGENPRQEGKKKKIQE